MSEVSLTLTGRTQEELDEEVMRAAVGANERWYLRQVASIVEMVKENMIDGHYGDLQECIHEAVDGSGAVIYTFQNHRVLQASDNRDAYEEIDSHADLAAQAFWALHSDVTEYIGDWTPSRETEDEDEIDYCDGTRGPAPCPSCSDGPGPA